MYYFDALIIKSDYIKAFFSKLSFRQSVAKNFQMMVFFPIFIILKILFDFEIKGKCNLKQLKGKSVIFAGNHNNRLFDGIISAVAIAKPFGCFGLGDFLPIRYLAYKNYFEWFRFTKPIFFPVSVLAAFWLRISNCIPIKERNKNEIGNISIDDILNKVVLALKSGERIFIFPEGKTGGDNKLRKGKNGVSFLHKETGVPIIPVAIKGSYKMFSFNNLFRKSRRDRKIVIIFGKPIYYLWKKNDKEKNLKDGANLVMDEIKKLLI